MKKVFTLVLAMTIVVAGFAQVKSVSHNDASFKKAAKMQVLTGFEERDYANVALTPRSEVVNPEETELSQTFYDWQSNAAARNFTAVWPDGYAVMCYTQGTDASYSDRGTGLAIWDPEVGEWEYTETRVEGVKTGFGSIARYKENGLVVAAHTASDLRIFLVEDFRDGNRDFGTGIQVPTDGEDGRTQDICWPVVQCSGDNLDIIHILATEYALTEPYPSALLYSRYENEEFTVRNHVIPNIDANHVSDGGSNIAYFMPYDPAKPNRVSFILNNAWSDGKLVISENNGADWSDRVFYQHPGIDVTYEDWFMYPRWTGAAFDNNDNLHIVYEFNGTTGEPGSGSYYPGVGGIGYWSEILPKNDSCVGGIGAFGLPFIMDTTYLYQDIYASSPYWSDATHSPLPEHIGDIPIVDNDGNVVPWDEATNDDNFPSSNDLSWSEHGAYNSGKLAFASMFYNKEDNRIFAFWSSIAGDATTMYVNGDAAQYYYRLFGNISVDGGRTWKGMFQVLTDFMNNFDEMSYPVVIPYLYSDDEGEYVWVCFQSDQYPGTFVQQDDPEGDDNFYHAVKVYVEYMWNDVEENGVVAPTTMTVFPNPAQGVFTLELNNEANVNIFNAVGQLVKTYNNVKSVEVRDLEAGIYFVKSGDQTQKVVVF